MNEIEKMYENAGIEKSCNSSLEFCPVAFCDECNFNIYPLFTAEKQLELIKWFVNSKYYRHAVEYVPWILNDIAMYINSYWDIFTNTERTEVKEILEN